MRTSQGEGKTKGEGTRVIGNAQAGFLTETDLAYMTDLVQPAAQIRWLRRWNIRHTVSATGRPRVTWQALAESKERRERTSAKDPSRPDLGHLRKLG